MGKQEEQRSQLRNSILRQFNGQSGLHRKQEKGIAKF
jgi:hypothetical protein